MPGTFHVYVLYLIFVVFNCRIDVLNMISIQNFENSPPYGLNGCRGCSSMHWGDGFRWRPCFPGTRQYIFFHQRYATRSACDEGLNLLSFFQLTALSQYHTRQLEASRSVYSDMQWGATYHAGSQCIDNIGAIYLPTVSYKYNCVGINSPTSPQWQQFKKNFYH